MIGITVRGYHNMSPVTATEQQSDSQQGGQARQLSCSRTVSCERYLQPSKDIMSWFRGKSKEPEPAPSESPFSADTSAFEGSTNFASGPPSGGGGGGAGGGMADLQVWVGK